MSSSAEKTFPVVRDLADFDRQSGTWAERLLFNNRLWVVTLCALVTLLLGWQLPHLRMNASFDDMIPTHHPYIVNFLAHRDDLKGLGNRLTITLEAKQGNIFAPAYLEQLRQLNDELLLLPQVDRPFMKSLWTPNTRWIAVTEDGLDGGPVIPDDYRGDATSVAQVRRNVERSGEIGQLVAANFGSSVIQVPLLDHDPVTNGAIDYGALSRELEKLRTKYQGQGVELHITGFAKLVGELISGAHVVAAFFALAVLISVITVYWYTRCVRSTVLVAICSIVAVIWQMGLLPLLGFGLDPYSMLVPFLIFAIGMSHGAQKMNGIMQDVGRGTHQLIAARYTFRRLFLAGLTALLCDAVGFGVLMTVDIKAIQDLAITASIGVAVLVLTNLVLLPILLSYTGVGSKAAQRSLAAESRRLLFLDLLVRFTERRWALPTLALSVLLAAGSFVVSRHLQIGDLDPGAPELRAHSRYNRDIAYFSANYSASADVLVVMVKSADGQCAQYAVQSAIDSLEQQLQQLPGVVSTMSLAGLSKGVIVGMYEGNYAWYELLANQGMLNAVTTRAPRELLNQSCSLVPVFVFLQDHKADTLTAAVNLVESFAAENNSPDVKFMLGAGNAGIEAATNIVVLKASHEMLFWVYGAVILLCFVTFRSWRAVAVAIIPLVLTSMLCEALMVGLGIGVKVATLPVIALGVGIGVDYALYVLSTTLTQMRAGASLGTAYAEALRFTGKVVMLTGVTLGLAVSTWVFSPIKFQADMGLLLGFMFIWNMLGALILLPALAYILLKPVENTSVKIARVGQVV